MFNTRKFIAGMTGALAALTVAALVLPGSPVSARQSQQASACNFTIQVSSHDAVERTSVSSRGAVEFDNNTFRGSMEMSGTRASIVGETTGYGLYMVIGLPDGSTISAMGGGANRMNTCNSNDQGVNVAGMGVITSSNPLFGERMVTWTASFGK